ncbi:putative metalloprotease CJM1_0395 family protein [Pleionea mediterranea]|uniref:SprA family protein n=1 Tax=Pleionea mediterranea TaxID=523701 RepID=A0A316GB25_9GAMM|nr:putative metalloprotease CJM1_0395 family protein [Pleionea mediterranea]PWK51707.1 SprA family protein [Pleionea mediterranea]
MVINPSPIALPVQNANLTTESARNDVRLQERIPETKATSESVNLKPSNEDSSSTARAETRNGEALTERAVQDRSEQQSGRDGSGREQPGQESSGQKQSAGDKQQNPQQQAQERQEIQQLQTTDREVRAHEAAHTNVGGQYAGAASFSFERGPDGKRYAVSGEVPIDLSRVNGDPAATIDKMKQVRQAALAPVDPSTQDVQIATKAAAIEAEARAELQAMRREQASGDSSGANTESDKPGRPNQNDSPSADVDPRAQFELRLKGLGVIDSPDQGTLLSVSA